MSIVQQKLPDCWTVNREKLGTRLSCFGSDRNGGTFSPFHKEGIGELLAKNRAYTARRQLDQPHILFGEICRTEQPFIS